MSEKQLGVEKTMTVKEVAEVLGCGVTTIQKHVKEMFPEIVENGKTTRLNEVQVTAVKKMLQEHKLGKFSELENVVTRTEIILHVQKSMEYLERLIKELQEENEDMKVGLDCSDLYATVVKYDKLNAMGWDSNERQQMGKYMANYCRERNMIIKVAYSGAYNPVFSYPMSAWNSVYSKNVPKLPYDLESEEGYFDADKC